MKDGLTESEWEVLKTPIKDCKDLAGLFALYKKRESFVRRANKKHKSTLDLSKAFYGYGSDYINGPGSSVFNHADGRMYDSKSEYHKAVKAKGCVVVGNDYSKKEFRRPEVKGDFNIRPQFKEAIEKAFQQASR